MEVTQMIEIPEFEGDESDIEMRIEHRIRYVLTIYPRISPSMLQIGLGTGLSADIWKPVLARMIDQGSITKSIIAAVTPSGRQQTMTTLELAVK